jgi:hypothetical protein
MKFSAHHTLTPGKKKKKGVTSGGPPAASVALSVAWNMILYNSFELENIQLVILEGYFYLFTF